MEMACIRTGYDILNVQSVLSLAVLQKHLKFILLDLSVQNYELCVRPAQ